MIGEYDRKRWKLNVMAGGMVVEEERSSQRKKQELYVAMWTHNRRF